MKNLALVPAVGELLACYGIAVPRRILGGRGANTAGAFETLAQEHQLTAPQQQEFLRKPWRSFGSPVGSVGGVYLSAAPGPGQYRMSS